MDIAGGPALEAADGTTPDVPALAACPTAVEPTRLVRTYTGTVLRLAGMFWHAVKGRRRRRRRWGTGLMMNLRKATLKQCLTFALCCGVSVGIVFANGLRGEAPQSGSV